LIFAKKKLILVTTWVTVNYLLTIWGNCTLGGAWRFSTFYIFHRNYSTRKRHCSVTQRETTMLFPDI